MELIFENKENNKVTKSILPEKNLKSDRPIFLNVENVSLSYNEFLVFEAINFEIPKNQITTLVGPSGSGKSSLLYSFNRLIDHNPNVRVTGHIHCCGQNILTSNNVKKIRTMFGLVFQKPNPFPLSIYKNLDIPLRENSNLNKYERKEKIQQCLLDVGLWDEVKNRLDHSALTLSGGQQQRLCIARCLVLDPELLLLDEPTSSLDPVSERKIENLLIKLKDKITILLVTHKMKQMRSLSDNVVLFWPQNGKTQVYKQGSLQDLIRKEGPNSFVAQYLKSD